MYEYYLCILDCQLLSSELSTTLVTLQLEVLNHFSFLPLEDEYP